MSYKVSVPAYDPVVEDFYEILEDNFGRSSRTGRYHMRSRTYSRYPLDPFLEDMYGSCEAYIEAEGWPRQWRWDIYFKTAQDANWFRLLWINPALGHDVLT